jgi:hypothetical protein
MKIKENCQSGRPRSKWEQQIRKGIAQKEENMVN